MIFFDTETCGLTGPIVLIQYAEDDGSVTLHEVWRESISDTIRFINRLCSSNVCAYNLVFDWFHINKLYNIFICIQDKSKSPRIDEVVSIAEKQPTEYCLKPQAALDLFLHAKKSCWQSLMPRKNITIKWVPTDLADQLLPVLNQKIQLPNIYFAKSKTGETGWKVEVCENKPNFSNIVLRFKASLGLKPLCSELFKTRFLDYPVPKNLHPIEANYNPYTTEWKCIILDHILFWQHNKQAKSYAEQDVVLLQRLHKHFNCPPAGDDDSELACAVGAARWRGFSIDKKACQSRLVQQHAIAKKPSVNINSHIQVRRYLKSVATEKESLCINDTTAETLNLLSSWLTELGIKAKEIYDARRAEKEETLLLRLLEVDKFCPELKVIGTRSGRMSGGTDFDSKESINPQGIQKAKEYRSLFTLFTPPDILSGGDFKAFEVTIADAAYKDRNLREDLQSGKSFHGLFGSVLYSVPYEQILTSKGTDRDYYTPSKTGTFGLFYGQQPPGLARVVGISEEQGELAYSKFIKRYPQVGLSRKVIFDAFCSMRQPGGEGSRIFWREPAEYIESLLGFRRYFSVENDITRSLFELAQNPPEYLKVEGSVQRRKRIQTPRGAMQSALYACAFILQAYNMRAAANHVIQSTGAEICKHLQRCLWDLQPKGVSTWGIQTLNVHDEIMAVHDPKLQLTPVVQGVIEKFKPVVPLLDIDWKTNIPNWGAK